MWTKRVTILRYIRLLLLWSAVKYSRQWILLKSLQNRSSATVSKVSGRGHKFSSYSRDKFVCLFCLIFSWPFKWPIARKSPGFRQRITRGPQIIWSSDFHRIKFRGYTSENAVVWRWRAERGFSSGQVEVVHGVPIQVSTADERQTPTVVPSA